MNTTKKVTIFDNYNGYGFEEIKQAMIEENIQENENNLTWINYEPNENDVIDYSIFLQDIDWKYLEDELDKYLTHNTLIVATNNDWINGTVLNSVEDFCELINDCDYVVMYDDNGSLHLNFARHNSGFCYTELKLLTNKGKKYLKNHNLDLNDKEIKTLLSKTYSKKPNYAKIQYGC